MIDPPLTENPFWDFSLTLYSNEAVAALCLTLQDDWDADVNLLLYATWLAHHGIAWSSDDIIALQKEFDLWRKNTILPLRTVRRRLRFQTKRRYYNFLKSLELRAERHQQDKLWTHYHESRELTPPILDEGLFKQHLSANLLLYLQRLEMRPRTQSMWPKAHDQLEALISQIMQSRKGHPAE